MLSSGWGWSRREGISRESELFIKWLLKSHPGRIGRSHHRSRMVRKYRDIMKQAGRRGRIKGKTDRMIGVQSKSRIWKCQRFFHSNSHWCNLRSWLNESLTPSCQWVNNPQLNKSMPPSYQWVNKPTNTPTVHLTAKVPSYQPSTSYVDP